MAITLPLTLLGLGLLIYYLFGFATHALPIAVGLAAGFAAAALGFSTPVAVLIGTASAFVTIAGGRFVGLTACGSLGRGLLIALFAIPAAVAGGVLGSALANLAGFAGLAFVAAPLAGLACGRVAADRLVERAG
jgi:hypothetical protein